MKIWSSLLAVVALVLIAWLGVDVFQLTTLFGIALPYAAFGLLLVGIIIRVVRWGKSPFLLVSLPVDSSDLCLIGRIDRKSLTTWE